MRSAFWHDDRLVVIEDVPALVCNTCGEQFYDDAAVRLIDRMRANGFPPEDAVRELRVPVFAFGNIARPRQTMSPARGVIIVDRSARELRF